MLKQDSNSFLPYEETIKRMKEENIQRIMISYKIVHNQSVVIRGVLSFENGKFTGLLAISNHPRLASTRPLTWGQGLRVIKNLYDGVYTIQTVFLKTGIETNVRGEVVLG